MKRVFDIFSRKTDLLVIDAMNPSPKTISPDANVLDASNKMIKTGMGSLLVVEGDILLGIITKTDIIENIILHGRSTDMKVVDVKLGNVKLTDNLIQPSTTYRYVLEIPVGEGVGIVPGAIVDYRMGPQ